MAKDTYEEGVEAKAPEAAAAEDTKVNAESDENRMNAEDMSTEGEMQDGARMTSEGESKIQAELDGQARVNEAQHIADQQMTADKQAAGQKQDAQRAQRGPKPFSWKAYKGLRDQQRATAEREQAQGQKIARGYIPVEPFGDKSVLNAIQASMFAGAHGLNSIDVEAEKRQKLMQDYKEQFERHGTEVTSERKLEATPFEDKLFNGFRLDRKMGGKPVLSYRIQDPNNGFQQIFDDGKSVRACTNGAFNARTAMGMASTFFAHRGHIAKAVNNSEIDVNINVKKTMGGAMGGTTAAEKRNLMIIANLHLAHKTGIKANIQGKNIGTGPNALEKYMANGQNLRDLEDALREYNEVLAAMGELPNGQPLALADLIEDPRSNNLYGINDGLENGEPSDDVSMDAGPYEGEEPSHDADHDEADNEAEAENDVIYAKGPEQHEALPAPENTAEAEASEDMTHKQEILGPNDPDPAIEADKTYDDSNVPEFKTSRRKEAETSVASLPRATDGNGAPASVQDNVKPAEAAPQAPKADDALGVTRKDTSEAGTPSAKVQPEQPKAEKKPEPNLPIKPKGLGR